MVADNVDSMTCYPQPHHRSLISLVLTLQTCCFLAPFCCRCCGRHHRDTMIIRHRRIESRSPPEWGCRSTLLVAWVICSLLLAPSAVAVRITSPRDGAVVQGDEVSTFVSALC